MLPDRVSNPGPLTYESGALPIALRGPAWESARYTCRLKYCLKGPFNTNQTTVQPKSPSTVPCRIIFAKPEDLEMWPNHLSLRFLTKVRGNEC